MPIYEYQCTKCGEFEVNQRITDDPLKRCPTCRGKVKKLISNTSFQLKGSGWYQTDYGSKKSAKEKTDGGSEKGAGAAGGASAGSSESTSKSETSGAEKPAATKDKSASKKDTSAQAA